MRIFHSTFLVIILLSVYGCALSIPAPTITYGSLSTKFSQSALRSTLCGKNESLIELPIEGDETFSVGVQCANELIVVVVFNSHGIRTNTLTIKSNGEFSYEVTYLGRKIKFADELVSAVVDTSSITSSTLSN